MSMWQTTMNQQDGIDSITDQKATSSSSSSSKTILSPYVTVDSGSTQNVNDGGFLFNSRARFLMMVFYQ